MKGSWCTSTGTSTSSIVSPARRSTRSPTFRSPSSRSYCPRGRTRSSGRTSPKRQRAACVDRGSRCPPRSPARTVRRWRRGRRSRSPAAPGEPGGKRVLKGKRVLIRERQSETPGRARRGDTGGARLGGVAAGVRSRRQKRLCVVHTMSAGRPRDGPVPVHAGERRRAHHRSDEAGADRDPRPAGRDSRGAQRRRGDRQGRAHPGDRGRDRVHDLAERPRRAAHGRGPGRAFSGAAQGV